VQEKADEYTKISESQKKTINNCFLSKATIVAAKGNSGSEKAILVCAIHYTTITVRTI
jgi:hypothetical protein